MIQVLGQLPIGPSECKARRQAALADWVAQGHSEAQIRALVKGNLALQPLPEAAKPVPKPSKVSK